MPPNVVLPSYVISKPTRRQGPAPIVPGVRGQGLLLGQIFNIFRFSLMSQAFYFEHAGGLNRELKASIPADTLRALHKKRPVTHFLIAVRQVGLLIGLPLFIYTVQPFWLWLPASVLLGFVVFSFSILLHEAVHRSIFHRDRWGLSTPLGLVYGAISGLSYSQYKRWHLDHHDNLGSEDLDPKRAHLTPKIHAVWYKLLYCSPALFFIYFRAVAETLRDYPDPLRRRIRRERIAGMAFHLAVLGGFWTLDPGFALKGFVIPVLFVFPIAFTLNRLGQHYVIDPEDVAQWSTLMRSNGFWNFLYLFSTYHLEHHYFPGVPFYNLKRLQEALKPFCAGRNMPLITYGKLIFLWFFKNHEPHTKLDLFA